MTSLEYAVSENLIDRIAVLLGKDIYPGDAVFVLFEGENGNGSMDLDPRSAADFISDYFFDIGEVYEEMIKEWGVEINPFSDPEQLEVLLNLYIGEMVFPYEILDAAAEGGDTVKITKELCDAICKALYKKMMS